MNEKGHVLNAFLLSIGLGYLLEPAGDVGTFVTIAQVTPPIVLGALFPDVDTSFGSHRKTFHNVWVLGVAALFPLYFGNLHWVWLGVLTHFVLDFMGTKRGLALFYPWNREFDFPLGVEVSSRYADVVTLLVTALELGVAAALIHVAPGTVEALVSQLPFDPQVGNATQVATG